MLRHLTYTSKAARPLAARRAAVPTMSASRLATRFYSDKAEGKQEQPAADEQQQATEEPQDPKDKEVADLKGKFEAKDRECAALKERYQRSVADFRNLQNTTKREMQKARDLALKSFAKDLLESVDNFDRALSVVTEETKNSSKEVTDLFDGIKMTQDVFEKTLAKHGLVKVDPLGEQFDPNVHEAVFQVPQPEKEAGTVMHVQQTGFTLNNVVLRAPKVGVVKGEE